jgi:hypothetical protein
MPIFLSKKLRDTGSIWASTHMPCINIQIDPVGPTLDVGIAIPGSLQTPGKAPANIQWFKALVDTGCSHTSIHTSVANSCGLKVMGKTGVTTPSGNVACNVFHGDLFVRSMISWNSPFEWKFNDLGFVEMLHKNPAFDILLGMDLLNQGVLTLNGGLKQATFCW